jgi:hypothetical protein
MELDEASGDLPSLAESFASNAGRTVHQVFSEFAACKGQP